MILFFDCELFCMAEEVSNQWTVTGVEAAHSFQGHLGLLWERRVSEENEKEGVFHERIWNRLLYRGRAPDTTST